MKNIVLTGFMGTGKTTVGRLLAARTGRAFVDTDELIEQRAGKSIAAIFAGDGAHHFRQLEREVAAELAPLGGLVIGTGGRLMLDPENAAALGSGSLVICLNAPPQEILQRIATDGARRPLLDVPQPAQRVAELLEQRAQAYGQFPQIDTAQKRPAQVVAELIETFDLQALPRQAPPPQQLTVTHPQGSYDVIVGSDLLPHLRELAPDSEGNLAIITDSNVGPLYSPRLAPESACTATFSAGEAHKTLDTVQGLYEQLLEAGVDRSATVVALGGGVVGDVGGFVAATYLRGVRLVQCPTSLLAMVDASVGGKTGVDMPQGKNLVGAFKQPAAVLADVGTLRTLPPAQFAAGMAEVVKHALIAGGDLLSLVERGDWRQERLFQADQEQLLVNLIVAAIGVKRDVVQIDPFEQGRRAILNLGHTFAHAIERVSNYDISHGHAVAMGLVAAADLSARLEHCDAALQLRLEAILERLYLPTRIPASLRPDDLLAAMGSDKKKVRGRLRFVLLRDVGDVFVTPEVPGDAVLQTLQELQAS